MSNRINVVRTFDAPAPTVFAAWVSPSSLVAPVTMTTIEPVVGGAVRLSTGGRAEDDLTGTVIRAEAPNLLSYTWRWGDSAEETIVEVSFHPAAERTIVDVDHRGFLDDRSRLIHLEGWVSYLDGLASYL